MEYQFRFIRMNLPDAVNLDLLILPESFGPSFNKGGDKGVDLARKSNAARWKLNGSFL